MRLLPYIPFIVPELAIGRVPMDDLTRRAADLRERERQIDAAGGDRGGMRLQRGGWFAQLSFQHL